MGTFGYRSDVPVSIPHLRVRLGYSRAMRRDSQLSAQVVELLAARGVQETGRRLERYSQVGLLPPGNLSPTTIADHVQGADLAHTYRPGLSDAAHHAALVAAARGHGCQAVYAALEHTGIWGGQAESTIDPWTDDGNRAIGESVAAVERFATGSDNLGMPPQMAKFFRLVLDSSKDLCQEDPITDPHLGVPETPEQSLRSGIEGVLTVAHAGKDALPEDEPLHAMVGLGAAGGPPSPDVNPEANAEAITSMLDALADAAPGAREGLSEAHKAPLEDLVRGAVWWREMIGAGQGFRAHFDSEELDWLAGALAPLAVALEASGFPLGKDFLNPAD